jgi:hypothetical protein
MTKEKILIIGKLREKRTAHSYAHCLIEIERGGGDPTLAQLKAAHNFFRYGGKVLTLLPEGETV